MLQVVEYPSDKRKLLLSKYEQALESTKKFSRKTVSFQANKLEPVYRWFKYKEGFASVLVKSIINEFGPGPSSGPRSVFDPFAGAGTTLFAARELGWDATGIELLPVGTFVMEVRQSVEKLDLKLFNTHIETFWEKVQNTNPDKEYIQHIPITKDAFPVETDVLLNKYLAYSHTIEDENVRNMFLFAAFSILEEISYTRKDGQYLRWDSRSPRTLKGQFNKGKILPFEDAIKAKLNHISTDLDKEKSPTLFADDANEIDLGQIQRLQGSCLDMMPTMPANKFDLVITSPPYCNRYDYTRTYALELIFLGYTNDQVRDLRQTMLSCTVENKEKIEHLRQLYKSVGKIDSFEKVMSVYQSNEAMSEINAVLQELNLVGKLNNPNIARMVKNYFLEMCFVTYEMARVLKPGGRVAMVNDNVRYGGEEIPVDLILSEFAAAFGMEVEKIFVLLQKKGNSSQQMGAHGRTETRKCVYIWRKEH